jgi:hypothetical protein
MVEVLVPYLQPDQQLQLPAEAMHMLQSPCLCCCPSPREHAGCCLHFAVEPKCAETRHTLLSRPVVAFEQRHAAKAALLHSWGGFKMAA